LPGVVRDVYRYHVVDRGYADIGYNFVIDHRGNVYEGRWARNYAPGEIHDGEDGNGLGVMAAHAEGVNAGSCGVVLIGDFSSQPPSDAAVNALIQLLAWKAARHQIDPWDSETYTGLFGQVRKFPNIVGHRSVGFTVCPGNGLNRKLDAIRGSVKSIAGSFGPDPIDMSKAIRYKNLNPITPETPTGNDVRPGASNKTTATTDPAPVATAISLGTLVGVRVLSSGGNLTTLGKAQKFGSPAQRGNSGTIAITPGPAQSYWTIDEPGNVLAFGGASAFGSLRSTGETTPAVDLAGNRAGTGYWILTKAGGVWSFGATGWLGSIARSNPGVEALRMHATPSGKGYWILGADGGIYAYGDATWYGSAAKAGATDAVDFWPTPSGKGYWIATASGRVLAFGDAIQKGGMSDLGVKWRQPAVAVVGTPDGRGYHVLSADGGVYSFGAAPFFGSLAGSGRAAVALAPAVQ
jgi:N-acetylmuramoyl-L-alanine amidase